MKINKIYNKNIIFVKKRFKVQYYDLENNVYIIYGQYFTICSYVSASLENNYCNFPMCIHYYTMCELNLMSLKFTLK